MTTVVLRGARVITMAPGRPDADSLDILVDGAHIAGLGEKLDAGGDVVDLSGRVVIPGLVNAHLHVWQSALRGIGANWTLLEYLRRVQGGLAAHYSPDDIRIGTLAGAMAQINSGTTTIGGWCENNPSSEHTDAAVAGLRESGIRAVFLLAGPGPIPDAPYPVAEIDRVLPCADALLTVGMAVNGPQLSTPQVAIADLREAAERGIVSSMHQSGGAPAPAWEAAYIAGAFGPQTNIVHGAGMTGEWVGKLVGTGATFTVTAEGELGRGHGQPITPALLEHGGAPALGTDTDTAVPGEMLSAARIALAQQRNADHDASRAANGMMAPTSRVSAKEALAWATIEGARALGLADRVGRIEVGMQADLAIIDSRALNLWPARDPVAAALHAGLANIEAVMVAGQWRKRHHRLTHVDVEDVLHQLSQSASRLLTSEVS